MIAEGNYVNGLHGTATGNTATARYLAEGKFTEGKEDGRWKQTYPNGKLAFEGESTSKARRQAYTVLLAQR